MSLIVVTYENKIIGSLPIELYSVTATIAGSYNAVSN